MASVQIKWSTEHQASAMEGLGSPQRVSLYWGSSAPHFGDRQLTSTQKARTIYGCSIMGAVSTTLKWAASLRHRLVSSHCKPPGNKRAQQQMGKWEAPWGNPRKSCTGSSGCSGRDLAEPFSPCPLEAIYWFSLLDWRGESNAGICREHTRSWGGNSWADAVW